MEDGNYYRGVRYILHFVIRVPSVSQKGTDGDAVFRGGCAPRRKRELPGPACIKGMVVSDILEEKERGKEMKESNVYIMGVMCGILCVMLMCVLIRLIFKHSGISAGSRMKGKYDERQVLLQGKGYKLGFYTMMAACMIYSMLDSIFELPVMPFVGIWGCILLGLGAFAVYCIIVDAYIGVGARIRSYVILCVIIIVTNLASVVMNGLNESLHEDGIIGVTAVNLMCAVLFAFILAAFGVRKLMKNRDDEQ